MDYRIIDEPLPYTGRELRSGWVAQITGFERDAAAGFVGACDVANEDLVDLDDARAGTFIKSARMAHVIVEHPRCGLDVGVLRQRLLVCLLEEILSGKTPGIRRDGDDLYIGERKLTVSIAAPSPASCLIHLGINIDPDGAPVAAVGLDELGIDAKELLDELLRRYRDELAACRHAEGKVRSVP